MVSYANRLKGLSLVALILMAGILVAPSCSLGGSSSPVESIIIGTMANAGDTLIFVADEQEYFKANGLNVTLKTYANGLAATNAMLEGEADLAYATEFVVVEKALEKEKINIITTYSKNNTVSLVGRKGRGIDDISDLKDKKIGLARGTINEFYLGRLLTLNGLGIDNVTLIDTELAELGDALISGDVDAIIAGSKHLYPIIQQLGNDVFVWPAHSYQPAFGTLVGKSVWINQHPELVKRLMKSLSESEEFVNRNPDQTEVAIQAKLNYDDEYMSRVWSEYQFSLFLDQSLITAMEDEARWMISSSS